jgi:hypothetical protein
VSCLTSLYDLIEVSPLHQVCIRDYEPNGTERLCPKSDTKVHRLGSIYSVQQLISSSVFPSWEHPLFQFCFYRKGKVFATRSIHDPQ